MKIVLAAIAAFASITVAAPANAETQSVDCAPEYNPIAHELRAATVAPDSVMTEAEWNQLAIGTRKAAVFSEIGDRGARCRDASTPERVVKRWDYYGNDGYVGEAWLTFKRSAEGRWVLVTKVADQG